MEHHPYTINCIHITYHMLYFTRANQSEAWPSPPTHSITLTFGVSPLNFLMGLMKGMNQPHQRGESVSAGC